MEELTLDFTSGIHRQDQPLSIYKKDGGPLRENLVARIVKPSHGDSGVWTKANEPEGTLGSFMADDIRLFVKMTIGPEMWELLRRIDLILDGLRMTRPGRTTNLAQTEGLWAAHDDIKALIHKATKIGRKIKLSEDWNGNEYKRFEM